MVPTWRAREGGWESLQISFLQISGLKAWTKVDFGFVACPTKSSTTNFTKFKADVLRSGSYGTWLDFKCFLKVSFLPPSPTSCSVTISDDGSLPKVSISQIVGFCPHLVEPNNQENSKFCQLGEWRKVSLFKRCDLCFRLLGTQPSNEAWS